MKKQEKKTEIMELLEKENLLSQIEIIANVITEIGLKYIDTDVKKINIDNITDIVLKDIKKYGDTLPNSLVRQGMSMLLWLKK